VLGRHVIEVGADVWRVEKSLDDNVVVGRVLGDVVIVEEGAPEGTGDPPVVRILEIAYLDWVVGGVAFVVA